MVNQGGFEQKVKTQQIIESQLPDFILDESPKTVDFLRQYYISQEYQGGPSDIVENLESYINLSNYTTEIVQNSSSLSADVEVDDTIINVNTTKGYPQRYGLFKLNNEVITYTEKNETQFLGCIRGFSAITSYKDSINPNELVFEKTNRSFHTEGTELENISALFLREFYRKLKSQYLPGLEEKDFITELNIGNFVRSSKAFYASKGTEESFRILFNILYGETPKVSDLEDYLLKPSTANLTRREVFVVEVLSGDPLKLVGQTIQKYPDDGSSGSISEVEIFRRGLKSYYKVSLYIGHNENELINGSFNINAKTKVVDKSLARSNVITVDSTIGFPSSGGLIVGDNTITYDSKSINQFLNCSNINEEIPVSSEVRELSYIFGYENGDLTKKVEMRVSGVLSDFVLLNENFLVDENERIKVKNVGEKILNPEENKNYKQLFANSWIYNTSTRFQVNSIVGSSFTLKSRVIDKSSLKIGDYVDVLFRNSETVASKNAIVRSIRSNTVTLDNLSGFSYNRNLEYDIRRNLNKAKSNSLELEFGNDVITSDIQNVYNENDLNAYVTSNSLPSYEITTKLAKISIPEASGDYLQGYNRNTEKYSIISFDEDVPFITGDKVYYIPENTSIKGLEEKTYYVKVLSNKNQIRLYASKSFIIIDDYVEFENLSSVTGSHLFVLDSQKNLIVGPQRLLKKFPLNLDIKSNNSTQEETPIGKIGMLVNGVEISNYKSEDKIYYGPLESVTVLNGGSGYNAVDPPVIQAATAGSGTTAIIRPIVNGSIKEVLIEPQDFSVSNILSIGIVGGNGSGCILNPVLETVYKEFLFDARLLDVSGGVDVDDETISFSENHNFINGERIVYDPNGNEPLGIGTFEGSNAANTLSTLIEGSSYYAEVVNNTSIKLYKRESDFISGINTVGFTTANNSGFHKFRIYEGKTNIKKIQVISPGSGYENRRLSIKSDSVGISTYESHFYYKNHGFSDGDLVNYSTDGVAISGLSTINQYFISKIDDDYFRLCKTDKFYFNPYENIGISSTKFIYVPDHNFVNGQKITFNKRPEDLPFTVGVSSESDEGDFELPINLNKQILYVAVKSKDYIGITTLPINVDSKTSEDGLFIKGRGSNSPTYYFDVFDKNPNNSLDFERNKYVNFSSNGSGNQIVEYPLIEVNIVYSRSGVTTSVFGSTDFVTTPIVDGRIVGAYLQDGGSGYGSNILNFHKKPSVKVLNGNDARIKPIIIDGRIVKAYVQYGGKNYFCSPEIKVIGNGTSAKLKAIVNDGKVTNVVILDSGIGYDKDTTYLDVVPYGSGSIFDSSVRSLTLNNFNRYGNELIQSSQNTNSLSYSMVGYSTDIGLRYFGDSSRFHSPIIGWSYDGNPIYGPYGYSDSQNSNSEIKILESGYQLEISEIEDRPSDFAPGFFVEDYSYIESGDLDENNGRFCVTPEFPNGIYAYFAAISSNGVTPKFPYFIGNRFRSSVDSQNYILDQDFDFNSSSLIRNTYPYNVSEKYIDNDFIVEPNEFKEQFANVENISKGVVEDIEVLYGGEDYKVNDFLVFNNDGTFGGGASAVVSEVLGKDIEEITTSYRNFNNSQFIWRDNKSILVKVNDPLSLNDSDFINIAGLSTHVRGLNDIHRVAISSERTFLTKEVSSNPISGIVTDINVSRITKNISIGSSVIINNEVLSVINIFDKNKVLRVKRGTSGIAHTITTVVDVMDPYHTISLKSKPFNSLLNIPRYFNPNESVGVGSLSDDDYYNVNYTIGEFTYSSSVPKQTIYLPNHGFLTGQKVTLYKESEDSPISVKDPLSLNEFNLPYSGNFQELIVINKSKDYIGLVTFVGLTTNTEGLFFLDNGSDSYKYRFEPNHNIVTGSAIRIISSLKTSENHNLTNGDRIKLSVTPSSIVGLGTSSQINVYFDNKEGKILFNKIGFSTSSINLSNNTILIENHNLKTGDKIFYDSEDLVSSGLSTGAYFVNVIDDDRIQLCHTFKDLYSDPPILVNLYDTGGDLQKISLINPKINVTKNNTLNFNLGDSSLSGYSLKIFYDNEFKNEFTSIGTTSTFAVSGFGTVGVTSEAYLRLKYFEGIPDSLYYTLVKDGNLITPDNEVNSYSKIEFVDSIYNGSHFASGVSSDRFSIYLNKIPESLQYSSGNDIELKYSTSSESSSGPISKLRLSDGGSSYKKIPIISSVNSVNGKNASLVAKSKSIGKVSGVRILQPGFDYSVDKTLRPEGFLSPYLVITDSDYISEVEVIDGGKNYNSAPKLHLVNKLTREKVEDGEIICRLNGNTISSVEIIDYPKGLTSQVHELYAVRNSNGIKITKVEYDSITGDVDCTIFTPINGFISAPLSAGDKVFIEGINKTSTSGSGFNSIDQGYVFFTVSQFLNTNPAIFTFNISDYTNNPGTPSPVQSTLASATKIENYPQFRLYQSKKKFDIGEPILILDNDGSYFDSNLTISEYNTDYIKVFGNGNLVANDIIKGGNSGSIARISDQSENICRFNISHSLAVNSGWKNDIGKLNVDYQVLPDNDYYQNLSYSVKSRQTFEEIIDPVNSLLHTSGLKNFSDTEILQKVDTKSISINSQTLSKFDIVNQTRVDSISNFDLVVDYDVENSTSSSLRLQNKRVTDYIECKTNRTLLIDDISNRFSNKEDELVGYVDIDEFFGGEGYQRYLIQSISPNPLFGDIQINEVVLISDLNNVFTLEKGSLTNSYSKVGEFNGYREDSGLTKLRFVPRDPYREDYDFKIINSSFNSVFAGVGTTSYGNINVISKNIPVGVQSTSNIVLENINETNTIFLNIEIFDQTTLERNYIEILMNTDGEDVYISEYFVDTDNQGFSGNYIGTFSPSINSGLIYLNYTNNTSNPVTIRSNYFVFGNISSGIGTFRYSSPGVFEGLERTARIESNSTIVLSNPEVIVGVNSIDVNTFKTIAKVSYGNTTDIHQVLCLGDFTNTYTKQYPFISVGSTTGIGTFGSEYEGSSLNLKFYPNENINDQITVQTLSEIFYRDPDFSINIDKLSYGTLEQSFSTGEFSGKNGIRSNRDEFDLRNEGLLIFKKNFYPEDSRILDLETSTFKIFNHFFNTGEKLLYRPGSTVPGLQSSPIGIGSTLNNVGIMTDILPSEVYAIRLSNDEFKVATTESNALSGVSIDITSTGSGNSHEFEMDKKNEKTIIVIDNIIQSPIAYTPIYHNSLSEVGAGTSYIPLTGISSIKVDNVVKIGEEFSRVISVGLGETFSGPINGLGNIPLIFVERGYFGTQISSHGISTEVRVYSGNYNIVGSRIYLGDTPRGSSGANPINESNLRKSISSFNGRVFLRSDYSENLIFDDISDSFNGIGRTFNLTVTGSNISGINTGDGILLVNSLFQTPTTENNTDNNYSYLEDLSVGISSIVFSGISSYNGDIITNPSDVNQNGVPRGGVIISLGSTPGLGYAPLVGASVTAILDNNGSIVSVGLGSTDICGSGYYGIVSIGITDSGHIGTSAFISAVVGAGGSLTFDVISGGSGYTNPQIIVPDPSYSDLPVVGISRLGIGETTETGTGLLLTLDVEQSSRVGVGSTLFEVTSFKISRTGYGFKVGDVIRPVGLVTDSKLNSPIEDFELTILEVFNDSFASWNFGELDYIDNIKNLQDGIRVRFPLYSNGQLLSFEKNVRDPESTLVELQNILLIFINGVLQEPGDSYTFNGGSSFEFSVPPDPNDNISIFFYRGTKDEDSFVRDVLPSIEQGDIVRVDGFYYNENNQQNQNPRTVYTIPVSDVLETNFYSDFGIDNENYKPFTFIKKKTDNFANGLVIPKTRDSLESQVYPTAKVISDFTEDDTEIFLDNAEFFEYESSNLDVSRIGIFVTENEEIYDFVPASVEPVIATSGYLEAINVVSPGYGYIGTSLTLSIQSPPKIGVGVGTRAEATISINSGEISGSSEVIIINPGSGYSSSNPPKVLVPQPIAKYELITDVTNIEGFSGIVTGITTSLAVGNTDLIGIEFFLNVSDNTFTNLQVGYPIYISNTSIGNGLISVDVSDSTTVGVGTSYVDNIYIVKSINRSGENASIISNIHSESNISGISTSGSVENPVGHFSWGRLSGFSRLNNKSSTGPVSIAVSSYTTSSGLSTYPSVQRRGYGLRNTGALRKTLLA